MNEFFKLLYAIAKIAFITARIISSLDFISAVQYMIPFIYHFIKKNNKLKKKKKNIYIYIYISFVERK